MVGHKNIPFSSYTEITFYIVTSSTVRVRLAEIKREADDWNYGRPLYGSRGIPFIFTWRLHLEYFRMVVLGFIIYSVILRQRVSVLRYLASNDRTPLF